MNFLISGLVILSIISTPINKINNNLIQISLLNLKKNKKIIAENKKHYVTSEDISNILSEINKNFNTINILKEEKNKAKAKLNDKMTSFAKNKQIFTENQIEIFQASSKLIEKNEVEINYYIQKINNKKEMILLQNDILAFTNNLHTIYKKLCLILDYQIKIITNLYKSIFNLNCCLSTI